jgi:phage terminase large subunit-like protein
MTRTIPLPPTNIAGYDPTRTAGDCTWDGAEAARAVDFFSEVLTHPDDSHFSKAGEPLTLQPWQVDYIATLFGWKRPDGSRRYTESFVALPRKNGKSTLAAGIILYSMVADGRTAGQFYTAAETRDQASLIYRMAARMVNQSPMLAKRLKPINSTRTITYQQRGSFIKSIPSEAGPVHGTKPATVIFDEVHTQKNRDLYDALRTGQGATPNPLFISITTAGHDRHSICYELWNTARQVRDGQNPDPSFLPCIYELAESADWKDETTWAACNPNLGVSISWEFLRGEAARAKESPAYENTFRNLYLNQWCVTAETLFWMEDGSRRKAADLRPGDIVISFDEETQGLVKGSVTAVAPMPESAIYRIRTARGRVIRTNGEHPFWVRTGPSVRKQYGWKKARDLQPGDRILAALSRPCLTRGSMRIHSDGCYFLGMMIGDGTCNGTPRLTTADSELVAAFSEFVEGQGDAVKARPDGWHYDAVHKVKGNLKRTGTRKWLQARGVWGKTCYTKRIPDCVWKAGPAGWAEFASGYLDTDGHVCKSLIVFVSCNRDLLSDAQDLLAYLGIQSDLREAAGGSPGWRLEIRDAESFRICQEVLRPRVGRKAAALSRLPGSAGEDNSDQRAYDRVADVVIEPAEGTIGVTVEGWHTHVTNGLVTHNTEQAVRWLSMEKWEACGSALPDLTGEPCWAGLDLSTTTDLSALALAFPRDDGGFHLLLRFWVPRENLRKRARRDKVPYDIWEQQGFLKATEGDVVDYDVIRADINALKEQYNIQEIAIDRWNAAQITTQLMGDGFVIEQFGQGYASMSAPAKEFEKLVIEGKLKHGGHPVLRWMAANVAIEQDAAGNIKPSKAKSTERIDGIVASVMAVGRASTNAEQKWYYSTHKMEMA